MMSNFVDRNLTPVPLPSSRETWESRRKELRREILNIVGLSDLDDRGRLRWLSKGIIDRENYTIEKILFESYPGMFVPALVYAPKHLRGLAPAMVSISGHDYCDSKANLTVQARSVNLVRRGMIVIAYDYMDTFERNTGADPCALLPYGGGNDHSLTAFSYTSRTPTALEILDAVRAVDYLYGRKDVDQDRIGFTGESGGGNTTYWVAALDERVRLAVPVSSVTSFDYWIRKNRNWDWHQRPYGIRHVADIWTLLAMHAPRPMLVITSHHGTDDEEFPFEEADQTVRQAKRIYRLYGAEDNIAIWESRTPHGYQQDKREQMYSWVEHCLLRQPVEASPEISFQFEPPSLLRCGLPLGNKTNADVYSEWIAQAAGRISAARSIGVTDVAQQQLQKRLCDVLGVHEARSHPTLITKAVLSESALVVSQRVLAAEPGIDLPVIDFSPVGAISPPIVLVLGRSPETSDVIQPLTRSGIRVVFLDPRGTGEIDSGGQRTDNWAWFMGRTWHGMWIDDTRALITALGPHPIALIGVGRFGKTALFAAAIDDRIAAVFAFLHEVTYRAEVREGVLADVPRVLSVSDLPELLDLIRPRNCWLQFPRDITAEQIRLAYLEHLGPDTLRDSDGNSFHFTRSEQPDWSAVAKWLQASLEISKRR
jgi:pimeloyl-ACP methyl ester carboxylesterase